MKKHQGKASNQRAVLDKIKREELVDLTLNLGKIYSPSGFEKEIGEFVFNWLNSNGIETKKLGMLPDRFNILGTYRGSGRGYSLMFNAHLDVAFSREDKWVLRDAANPIYHQAWLSEDKIFGNGIVNDKGPLAATLIALKALKEAEVKLKGDVMLSASPGEVSREPVDEFEAPAYLSKDVGARYLVTHGGVADYVLVAEATNFGLAWVEAGKAFFKITVFGDRPFYTPFLPRPTSLEKSPNAIVRMAKVIELLEQWAYEYEKKNRREFKGGTVIPKASIGAIRGGNPHQVTRTSEICSIYLDVRLPPEKDPLEIKRELEEIILEELKLTAQVDLFLFRRGYEAKDPFRLVSAIEKAHRTILHAHPKMAEPPMSSMWRDLNVFNEVGIQAVTYGPGAAAGSGTYFMTVNNLMASAQLYALTALELCSQEKKRD